jgi:putative NADPH-quinone reductase
MQVLVVLAHPNDDSLNHSVSERACAALRSAGHEVHVLDLYALGFRAAMSREEHIAYHTDSPILDATVAEHAALVRSCAVLIFIYPTWWSSLPAILKGWLERVLVPGVGFTFNAHGKVRPGLLHVRRLVGISTYGSPRRYVKLVNDNGRRTILRTVRLNTGLRTRTTWLPLYRVDTSSAAQREAFLRKVERRMRAL